MAVQANGQAKQPNGHLKPSAAYRSSSPPSKGFLARLVSIAARLFIWYTAFTILFRCPSSPKELTADSPAVCEPYFQLRAAALPHVQPYYDTYLAPYAERAQPYVETAKVHVYQPAVALAQKHGAPRLAQLQKYGEKEWTRTVRPQLDAVKQQVTKQYDASLAPHVQKVTDQVMPYYNSAKTSTMDFYELEFLPAYRHTAPHARKLFDRVSRFTLDTALPYAQWTTDLTFTFIKRQIWPRLQVLYGENVEPQIFKISQRLGRYRDEKKIKAAADAAESSISSSTSSAAASSVASSFSSSVESVVSQASSAVAATPSVQAPVDEPNVAEQFAQHMALWKEQVAKAAHEGAEHLRERIDDICDRLINAQVKNVGEPLIVQLEEATAAVFISLKAKVETIIHALPEDASEDDVSAAKEKIMTELRKAGQTIKLKAQSVRDWRHAYDKDATNLVEAAANSTLETVDNIRELRLQDIGRRWASNSAITHKDWAKYNELKKTSTKWRDDLEAVALQHPRLDDARKAATDIEERAMAIAEDAAKELARLKDVSLWKLESRDSSDDFETKYVPPVAAKAKQAVLNLVSGAKEAALGSSQDPIESATSVASSKAADIASSASEAVLGSETGSIESAASKASAKILGSQQPAHGSVASVVSESASAVGDGARSVASAISESVVGTEPGMAEKAATRVSEAVIGSETPALESLSSAASSLVDASLDPKAASVLKAAQSQANAAASSVSSSGSVLSSHVASGAASVASQLSDSSPSVASVVSEASSSVKLATSRLSEAVPDMASQASESVASAASYVSEAAPDVPSASAKASKKVFGGAMAQSVPSARSIIFDEDIVDDDESYSQKVQDIISKAGDKASELTQAIQDAIKPTTTQDSVESITSLASAQYESALSAASSVLFGTEQGTGESIASVASEKYADAVTAASYAIYGSPSPVSLAARIASTGSSVSSELAEKASSRYSDAIGQASSHYSLAKSRVSAQISGTPKPVHQEMLASVESAYSDAVSVASEKLHAVLSHTSAFALPTVGTNVLSSVSSIASSRLSEGLSLASAQYSSAKVAAGLAPTPVQQKYLADAQRKYYEAIGFAHDRYAAFESAGRDLVSKASAGVQPPQTPAYESMLSAASSQYSVVSEAASKNMHDLIASANSIVDIDPSAAVESASSQYNVAISAASATLSSVSSKASEAIYGSSTPAYQSVLSDASSHLSEALSGTQTPWTEAMATQASANWEALVSRASEQVYGSPTPWSDSLVSQAGEYASQATDAAADQYAAVAALFSELVVGREPDFTESVMSRLQSAYHTGAPAIVSSASSYASDAYVSASSVVSSAFTPPATIEAIIDSVQQQIDAAVDAASVQFYGTTKGTYEQATEAAASMYEDASSKASEAIYGTQTGYAEAAQSQISDAASSAHDAISVALFGTPTGTIESITGAAASAYTSLSSVAAENIDAAGSKAAEGYESASSALSSAIYGPEQGALESAQSRISVAMESAKSKMAEFSIDASSAVEESVSKVQENVQDAVSSISSAATSVSSMIRDEL